MTTKPRKYSTAQGGGSCDRWRNGWFRFTGKAGKKMFEGCPGHNIGCGTKILGYLNGFHPNADEGRVSRNVCFRNSSSCDINCKAITVRKCLTYFVYHFRSNIFRDIGCPAGYCGSD